MDLNINEETCGIVIIVTIVLSLARSARLYYLQVDGRGLLGV
jgi:hypothetical protein